MACRCINSQLAKVSTVFIDTTSASLVKSTPGYWREGASRTSDSRAKMRVPFRSWNTEPALLSPPGARGFMGVRSSNLDVLCGSGKGVQPFSPAHLVGGSSGSTGSGARKTVRSLYDWSKSLFLIVGHKSDWSLVHVGLRQSCSLSPVLFIIFIDRILGFGNHRIASLFFADDVVLLASSSLDLQCALGRFAAKCEAAERESKSEGLGLGLGFLTGKR